MFSWGCVRGEQMEDGRCVLGRMGQADEARLIMAGVPKLASIWLV